METASYVALSRLTAQQRALDVTATNIANADTPGFQAGRVLFSDWLSRQRGTDAPPGGQVVAYTQDRATYRDRQAGALQHTGNPLDLALSGEGYFTVETKAGTRLTRAGRFSPLADGTLADADGNALLDAGGQRLRLSPADTRITVGADGTVSSENGAIGRVGVVEPADPYRLYPEGSRLLRADGPTAPVAEPKLVQGAVEGSNVQPVVETTRMMAALREFQFTAQFVQSEAERRQKAIDKLTQRRA